MSRAADFETGYQPLGSYYDEDQDDNDDNAPPGENLLHTNENGKHETRWNHIEDLDEFFTRVYQYHQRHGFWCMVVEDVLQLVQFLFVVLFSAYLLQCVKYDVLFADVLYKKITFNEVVVPVSVCVNRFDPVLVCCLLVSMIFWIFRLIKVVCNIFKYTEIRAFFTCALKISSSELPNLTWHEVQRLMLDVQREQQMCIHKQELTQLDIYHRILRFKNYMISMVNKNLVPLHYQLPFVGDWVYLSNGLKYNLEMILFWGPWAPFENNWHLKADYKNGSKRKELADTLSQKILWIGLANLVFSPVIFLWQILYFFFQYAELIKREPGQLGARRWSHYARLYLRHFNELDHEFNARLSRGYKASSRYMDIFVSPLIVVLAKNVVFFFGSILVVLILLTVIDEDTLNVSHILTTMTVLGVTVSIARSLIPDEHMVWCPELLMRKVLSEIHYIPDSWRGNAHTYKCRNEFAQLFQYKITHLLEELVSPLVTPFILCFKLRYQTQEIVDFYRHFTVEVVGVGDVCSFAQLNVRKHGHPQWTGEEITKADVHQQAEHGKTELSLMHFTLTNPEWRPPEDCSMFLNNLKQHAVEEMSAMPGAENALYSSINTLSSLAGPGYTSFMASTTPGMFRSAMTSLQQPPTMTSFQYGMTSSVRGGGVARAEMPLSGGSSSGILGSLHSCSSGAVSGENSVVRSPPPFHNTSPENRPAQAPRIEEGTLEMLSAEMSLSVLYLHEVHHRQRLARNQILESRTAYHFSSQLPSIDERGGTSPMTSSVTLGSRGHLSHMPGHVARSHHVTREPELPGLSPLVNLSQTLGSPHEDEEVRLSPDDQPPHIHQV